MSHHTALCLGLWLDCRSFPCTTCWCHRIGCPSLLAIAVLKYNVWQCNCCQQRVAIALLSIAFVTTNMVAMPVGRSRGASPAVMKLAELERGRDCDGFLQLDDTVCHYRWTVPVCPTSYQSGTKDSILHPRLQYWHHYFRWNGQRHDLELRQWNPLNLFLWC